MTSYDAPFAFTIAARGTPAFEVQSTYTSIQAAGLSFSSQMGMARYNFDTTSISGAFVTNDAGTLIQIDTTALCVAPT